MEQFLVNNDAKLTTVTLFFCDFKHTKAIVQNRKCEKITKKSKNR